MGGGEIMKGFKYLLGDLYLEGKETFLIGRLQKVKIKITIKSETF